MAQNQKTPVVFVGTKPTRPHFVCDNLRFEHWSGPNGPVPVLRMRNDEFGCMTMLSHENLSKLHEQIGKALEQMENGAAVEAKGALDGILKSFDPSKFTPDQKEGDSNAE